MTQNIKFKRRSENRLVPTADCFTAQDPRKFQPALEKCSNNRLFTLHDGVIYLKYHR